MGLLKQQNTEYLKHWTDLWFRERTGYVAVTDFKKQRFYGANDIDKVISLTEGVEDQYISINSFHTNWSSKDFSRRTKDLKQIRNIAVDIDQYNLGLTSDDAIEEIQQLTARGVIPRPNLIQTSRGVQIFYNIEGGASPDMGWLSSYITDQLIGKMKHIGADPNAKDLSRVMRVPYSVHAGNGATVKPLIYNDKPFTLQELQTYCKPLDEFNTRKVLQYETANIPYGTELMNRTNYARLIDLELIISLNNGDLTNMRNIFIYVYSFHQSLIESTQANLFHKINSVRERIYSRTDKPMSDAEFNDTVKRANRDASAFFEHIKDNGFKIDYKENDGIIKPYTSENLVKMFRLDELDDIEQMQFRTIVTGRIKTMQDKERKRVDRRSKGMKSMKEYNMTRKQQKQAKIDELKQLLSERPEASKTSMAKSLGIGRTYLYNLLKEIS